MRRRRSRTAREGRSWRRATARRARPRRGPSGTTRPRRGRPRPPRLGTRCSAPCRGRSGSSRLTSRFFAVVQIGSHQFKVSNGDCIFTERLKFCDINEKLILNKVLLVGSQTQTIVGRPTVPDAAVHAVVEEHALDAKVIIFKKKRRKNYRRTKGHRQELTKLRITDIQGIEKPEKTENEKPVKSAVKKSEKVAVAA
ncbi:hypothetical protein EUGRSUZ_L02565 [Eucalyptus grandis]|uniref:Large ribosomal subunit protein bL21m n=1 Tax=Eucalyptus grandis TaxID=71139 RepID=A0AAD9WIH0_EUCGR|nr:hypothetical protein EUGRSUZ_L02565 [Eucalyptus grandis]